MKWLQKRSLSALTEFVYHIFFVSSYIHIITVYIIIFKTGIIGSWFLLELLESEESTQYHIRASSREKSEEKYQLQKVFFSSLNMKESKATGHKSQFYT